MFQVADAALFYFLSYDICMDRGSQEPNVLSLYSRGHEALQGNSPTNKQKVVL